MKNNFIIPRYSGCGIYAIMDIVNLNVYVGQSKNIHNRAVTHKTLLKNKKHPVEKLNELYEKNFLYFFIIHKIDDEYLLNLYEKVYMYEFFINGFKLLNSNGFGNGINGLRDLIVFNLGLLVEPRKHINDVIEKTFYNKLGVFTNMKYREDYYI